MKNARSTSRSMCTSWMRMDRYCVRPTLTVHQRQLQNGMDGLQSLDSLLKSHIAAKVTIPLLPPPPCHPLPMVCAALGMLNSSVTISLDETTRSARDAMLSTLYQILHVPSMMERTYLWIWTSAAMPSSTTPSSSQTSKMSMKAYLKAMKTTGVVT